MLSKNLVASVVGTLGVCLVPVIALCSTVYPRQACHPAMEVKPVFGWGVCSWAGTGTDCIGQNCDHQQYSLWTPSFCFEDEAKTCTELQNVQLKVRLFEQYCKFWSESFCECGAQEASPPQYQYVTVATDCF